MAASAPAGKPPAAVGGEGKEMSDGAGSRMGVAGALSLSVTSSVAIVICNKYLISTLGFFFGEHACFRSFGTLCRLLFSCLHLKFLNVSLSPCDGCM